MIRTITYNITYMIHKHQCLEICSKNHVIKFKIQLNTIKSTNNINVLFSKSAAILPFQILLQWRVVRMLLWANLLWMGYKQYLNKYGASTLWIDKSPTKDTINTKIIISFEKIVKFTKYDTRWSIMANTNST